MVELSSFQIEGIATFKPKAAAFLNLSEDHLDRYGDLEAYGAAKKRLFRDMDPEDIAVLNADDPETAATSRPGPAGGSSPAWARSTTAASPRRTAG